MVCVKSRRRSDRTPLQFPRGGVPEWLKGPVSKTGVPIFGTVGSNPTSSASNCRNGVQARRLAADNQADPTSRNCAGSSLGAGRLHSHQIA